MIFFRACLHGGGENQIGEVKGGVSPHLSGKRDQIKMRDYMNRRVTPPKRVTSPSWGAPPLCNRPLMRDSQFVRLTYVQRNIVNSHYQTWCLFRVGPFGSLDFSPQ